MDPQQSMLLMVDVQEKLFRVMADRARLAANLQRLLRAAPALDVPVAVCEQTPDKLGPTISDLAADCKDAPLFPKRTFSGWQQPELAAHIRAMCRRQIVVAGIETHVCVAQTVRDLSRNGYTVQVVADAVASRTDANYRFGLEMCRNAGAALTTTEAILFDWMGSVDHPAFRTILKLVR